MGKLAIKIRTKAATEYNVNNFEKKPKTASLARE